VLPPLTRQPREPVTDELQTASIEPPSIMSVTKTNPKNLKIFRGESTEAKFPEIACVGSLPEMLRAFQRTTGHPIRYVADPKASPAGGSTWSIPVDPGIGDTQGHLRVERFVPKATAKTAKEAEAGTRELASAVAGMLGELLRTQHGLWQREADLAAGVPIVPHAEEERHLANRLQAVLRGGAKAVECHAGALYLLNEATTELKLRSSWGLPRERLTDHPRELKGCLADLEAMLGHAVVLEDTDILKQWNAPENFPSAICVPVSSPTTILGTLWFFSNDKRDFTDTQSNIIEVVAGRLAADLEREMLMREGVQGAKLKQQMAATQRMQRNQLPTIGPLLDGWDIAGWTKQAEAVGGDFFDWFALPDGLVAVAVADVMDRGLEAAMAASAVKAAMRSHGQYNRDADRLLSQVNMTLWTGSAGDQFASMFCGLVETKTGLIRHASAGRPAMIRIRPDGWQSISSDSPPLGEGPETNYREESCLLEPGEAMVVFTDGFRDAMDPNGKRLGEIGLAESLITQLNLPAKELVNIAKNQLKNHAASTIDDDHTVLIIKRVDP
jgi:phosphoserine phosphatase RsbU/P